MHPSQPPFRTRATGLAAAVLLTWAAALEAPHAAAAPPAPRTEIVFLTLSGLT